MLSRVAIYGALCLFGVVYLVPALLVFANAFRSPAEVALNGMIALPQSFSFDNWVRVWTKACVSGTCNGIAPNFYNSLRLVIPATIISTVLGALNGYVLSKWRFRGSELVFGMMLAGVFLPGQITLLPWAWIMGKLGLANNINGLILIHTVQGISFTTLFCRNFYVGLPDEIIKAARIDGAGFWRIFRRIVLPLSGPILAVTVIWQFTSIWNEYLFGMVFTAGDEQPITAALMSVRAGGSSAAVLIGAIPPLLVYLIGGKYFVRGLTQGALK
ncbi:carbohydrate ABC transporter permease [Devosia sp.]|uniref:carbohydrate ABC transporter permease n=1 Tax=Devosia sp. TaxID=1871048 RepID=UPI00260B8A47|nr:carbohydrate ABC transporter permease [Devosia sp.]